MGLSSDHSRRTILRGSSRAILIALGLAFGLCGPLVAQSANQAELISNFRLQHGEGKVKIDPTLNRIAHEQAAAMAASDVLDHSVLGPFGSRVAAAGSRGAAENIAFGYDNFPKTLDQWIASSGHRSNLLLHDASRVGVASVKSSKSGRTYWAMVIAGEDVRAKPARGEKTKVATTPDQTCRLKILSLCL